MPIFYPTISQITYFGVGDIDECAIIASFWAARQAGFTGRLPTISEFRRVAGRPDRPGSTGMHNSQIWKGVLGTGLGVGATQLKSGTTWSSFLQQMRIGAAASVSIVSGALPTGYRYGYQGRHQVGLVWENGQWYIADPLAPDGSGPIAISEAALKKAIFAYSGLNKVTGVLFSQVAASAKTPPAPVAPDGPPLPGAWPRPRPVADAFASARFYRARKHPRV